MDQVGPIIAAELERVKQELRRQKQLVRQARISRDKWRRKAIALNRETYAQRNSCYRRAA